MGVKLLSILLLLHSNETKYNNGCFFLEVLLSINNIYTLSYTKCHTNTARKHQPLSRFLWKFSPGGITHLQPSTEFSSFLCQCACHHQRGPGCQASTFLILLPLVDRDCMVHPHHLDRFFRIFYQGVLEVLLQAGNLSLHRSYRALKD